MLKETEEGRTEAPEEATNLMEVIFLNLGEPAAEQDPEHPSLLWLLDVLLSNTMETAEKKKLLETIFDIPMTKEMEDDMVAMRDAMPGSVLKLQLKSVERSAFSG